MIMILGVVLATAVAARKNVVATYGWFQEAADYAVRCDNMNGVPSDPDLADAQFRQYFDDGFSNVTQTTTNGNEYDPQAGSPFPAPIRFVSMSPINPGDAIPGGTANQPGYVISIVVPVLSMDIPLIGTRYVEVSMQYYAMLQTSYLST
jgi:hypothetical protein